MEETSDVAPAPSDPRARDHREKPSFAFGERDFVDHRQVYVGIHMPMHEGLNSRNNYRKGNGRENSVKSRPTKHYSYRKKRSGQALPRHSEESLSEGEDFIAPASERVKFILGTCDEGEEAKHELFTELEEFVVYDDGNEEWKETARWYKYEEDVEEGGDRWSKPHVATLSLYSLFELRSNLISGTVILDMEADDLSQIADRVLDSLVSCNKLEENARARVRDTILKRHRHQRSAGIKKGLSSIIGRRAAAGVNLGAGGQVKRMNSLNSSNSICKMQMTDNNAGATSGVQKKPLSSTSSAGLQSQLSTASGSIPNSTSFVRSESMHGHLVYQGPLPAIPAEDNDKLSGFMKKLPANAEASNVLVGEVDFLGKSITAFVRLQKGSLLGDLTEIPIPTRFLFIMLGPVCSHPGQYHEIGRAISTLLADEVFHDVAYKAKSREDLIAGIDEFLEQVTVLPPGEWDPSIRIDPPPQMMCKDLRRPALDHRKNDTLAVPMGKQSAGSDSGVSLEGEGQKFWERTKRPFGGLKCDLVNWKRRGHDIRDAFHVQSIGTILYIYFISLSLLVTLGEKQTESTTSIGQREHLLAFVFGGGLTAMFGGQPLILIGLTLPVVKFEQLLESVCGASDLHYLPFRLWIGLFSAVLIITLVGVDSSVFARYFTRFSQETFIVVAVLNLVFMGLSFLNMIGDNFPVHNGYTTAHACGCFQLLPSNDTVSNGNLSNIFASSNGGVVANVTQWIPLDVPFKDCLISNGQLRGEACSDNVFFLSVILMAATIGIAVLLASFRSTGYFPKLIRQFCGDFASLIAVFIVSLIAYSYKVNVPSIILPATYHPFESGRDSWIVPLLGGNPIWVVFVALVAAVPLTALFYIEYHMTGLIVNHSENKLKKSFGYHQDFMILGLVVIVCSLLGLPFVTTSCILSINHVQGLRIDGLKSVHAQFSGIREQKLTALLVTTLLGLSPLMMPALKHIPKPVLYGLLVYAAVRMLKGSQVMERVKVMLMPAKHQPDRLYLRQMPTITVHIFTIIQLVCIAILIPLRSSLAAVVFPFVVLLLVVVRALLELLLPQQFLFTLDDAIIKAFWRHRMSPSSQEEELLPKDSDSKDNALVTIEMGTAANEAEETGQELRNGNPPYSTGSAPNGTGPVVNISEELLKTAVWKQLVKDESAVSTPRDSPLSGSPNIHRKRRRKYPRGGSSNSRSSKKEPSQAVPSIIKSEMKKEDSPPPPPPWCEPYLSPPRADTKYLSLCANEVSIDPACSRSGSKTASMDEASVIE